MDNYGWTEVLAAYISSITVSSLVFAFFGYVDGKWRVALKYFLGVWALGGTVAALIGVGYLVFHLVMWVLS